MEGLLLFAFLLLEICTPGRPPEIPLGPLASKLRYENSPGCDREGGDESGVRVISLRKEDVDSQHFPSPPNTSPFFHMC